MSPVSAGLAALDWAVHGRTPRIVVAALDAGDPSVL